MVSEVGSGAHSNVLFAVWVLTQDCVSGSGPYTDGFECLQEDECSSRYLYDGINLCCDYKPNTDNELM